MSDLCGRWEICGEPRDLGSSTTDYPSLPKLLFDLSLFVDSRALIFQIKILTFKRQAGEMLERNILICAMYLYLIFNEPSVCLREPPVGHLKPFGGHRDPDVITDELDIVPHPTEFWEKYASKKRPVVFRGAAKHSR